MQAGARRGVPRGCRRCIGHAPSTAPGPPLAEARLPRQQPAHLLRQVGGEAKVKRVEQRALRHEHLLPQAVVQLLRQASACKLSHSCCSSQVSAAQAPVQLNDACAGKTSAAGRRAPLLAPACCCRRWRPSCTPAKQASVQPQQRQRQQRRQPLPATAATAATQAPPRRTRSCCRRRAPSLKRCWQEAMSTSRTDLGLSSTLPPRYRQATEKSCGGSGGAGGAR